MRRRWRLILPAIGLMLFSGVTHESLERRRYEKTHGRYFWWSSIRLDTHQIDTTRHAATPCKDGDENCVSWEPHVIEDPGWLTRVLILSALPTFLLGAPIVHFLGRNGANEIWSFMILMPLLVTAWYYGIGWLLDRWTTFQRSRST